MPNEVDFFVEELAGEREAWKSDHDAAMDCRDLEDLVRRGLGFYYMIRISDESWSRKVQSGQVGFDPDRARKIHAAYKWWLEPCADLIAAIQEVEASYTVDGAEEFRKCVRRARMIVRLDVESLVESMKQLQDGDVQPLTEEVWGALPGQSNTLMP